MLSPTLGCLRHQTVALPCLYMLKLIHVPTCLNFTCHINKNIARENETHYSVASMSNRDVNSEAKTQRQVKGRLYIVPVSFKTSRASSNFPR